MKTLKLVCGVILVGVGSWSAVFAGYLATITIMYRQGHTFHLLSLFRAFAPWILVAIVCVTGGFVLLTTRNQKGES